MRLLVFSDIHEDWTALERLMQIEADRYVAAGDLANWGRGLDKAGPLMASRAAGTFVLPGNHESTGDMDRFAGQFGMKSLHGVHTPFASYQLAGLGYSNPTPFATPGEYTEEEIAAHLKPFEGLAPLILICHCPPKDTALDRAGPGKHFGSTAIKQFIEKQQPAYFFCGHIHEAAGVQCEIGKTQCWNVGKKGHLLEVD